MSQKDLKIQFLTGEPLRPEDLVSVPAPRIATRRTDAPPAKAPPGGTRKRPR